MTPNQRQRLFVALAAAFIATAAITGGLITAAYRPSPYYFMPGPLGRVAGAGHASRRSEGQNDGNSVLGSRASDHPSFRTSVTPPLRNSGFLTRAFTGLNTPEEQDWSRHNHLTAPLFFSHNLANVFPRELYREHPEFFPLIKGKRLDPPTGPVFWQPDLGREDVARYAADQAKLYFDEHPGAETFSLGVNDGLNFGESPETTALLRDGFHGGSEGRSIGVSDRKSRSTDQPINRDSEIRYFRGRPDFSPLVFTFMNRAAADLARSYPDKYLGCLAYYWCENTPPFAVAPHVLPFLTADRTQSYDPTFLREEFDLQSRWARALSVRSPRDRESEVQRIGASANLSDPQVFRLSDPPRTNQSRAQPRIGLYDYLYGFGFLIPRVPIHAIAEHIRHAHEVGFTDYFAELNPNWGLDGPKPWVVAQLLQYPTADVDRLLDTYYTTYFQSAAASMRQFFDLCERQWMQQPGRSYWLKHYRNTSQAALFPSSVCVELRRLLTQATARADNDTVRQRVTFVSNAFGVTERFVAMCEARDALTTRILNHALSGAEGEKLLADYHQNRRDFFRYTHDLTERCPLAFAPINYDDWLRDDPTFAAREELAVARGSEVQGVGGSAQTSGTPTARARAAPARSGARELVPDGELAGALTAGRMIAGLRYGIDLPSPWQSRVEPTERSFAALTEVQPERQSHGVSEGQLPNRSDPLTLRHSDTPTMRALRLSGQESAIVFTWVPAKPGHTYAASAWTRAQVGPSDIVELVIGWLDAKNMRIGTPIGIRFPEESWPDWVQLLQGGKAPPGTAWVGIQLVVQHQVGSDWAEARDFSIREIAEPSSQ